MAGLGATLVRGVTSCWSLNPIADQRRAGELLRQACLAAPDHSEANGARAKLLRFQGKTAEAISILQRWTEIDPSNPSMLTELGIAYMYLGVPQKALSCIERAVDISPNAPNIGLQYWAMASCYQSLGHAREALTLLLSARASNPALPYVRGRLAGVFGQLGEIHEARQELDAARSLSDMAVRGDYTTLAAFRSLPQAQHPEFVAQCEPTLYAGLRKAGMPES
jgi:Flp pilus assembly protein TadD